MRTSLSTSSPYISKIRESNEHGREGWSRFASHRERVARILQSIACPGRALCVLGPGNLNDLDLAALTRRFVDIHLIDIDPTAVEFGLVQQGFTAGAGIHVHAPVDLTGILADLPMEAGSAIHQQFSAALIDKLSSENVPLGGQKFDVIVSAGVLSQLIQSVVSSAIDEDDATDVVLALRDKHIFDLIGLTKPGGSFILITDVVSTRSAPDLPLLDKSELAGRMATLVAARNFFTGLNPYRLYQLLSDDPRFMACTSEVSLHAPWLWCVTAKHQHLTCALSARRV